MKERVHIPPRNKFIVAVLAISLLLGSLFVIQYTDALFFVVIGWLLIPVFAAKLWDRIGK